MPLSYQQFEKNRSEKPQLYNEHILPQMDYLEANLREAAKTLNSQSPRDTARIREFTEMAKAIHTICHPGRSTWNSTKNEAMQKFGSLKTFLEAQEGRNFSLLESTMRDNPNLRADLHAEERRLPILGHLKILNEAFELDYYGDIERRTNRQQREKFLANRDKDPGQFRDVTAKQMDYLGGIFKAMAEELKTVDKDKYWSQIYYLELASEDFEILKNPNPNDPDQLERALVRFRALPERLLANNGELAAMMHSTVTKNESLKNLLPETPYLRKMATLQHFTEILDILDVEHGRSLEQYTATENELVTKEQKERDDREEEEKKEADRRAEEADAAEVEWFRNLENKMREDARQEIQKEQDQRAADLADQRKYRNEHGPFSLPPQYDNLAAIGMVLNDAKQNGPLFQAMQGLSQELKAGIEQWNAYFAEGGTFEKRRDEELGKLPLDASVEFKESAIEEGLKSVQPEALERFLQRRLGKEAYNARLEAELNRLGPNADPEQAKRNMYREELTESLRKPLRENAYSEEEIEKSKRDAALLLAAERRDAMKPEARQAYDRDKAQLRNDVIARRIRNRLLEACGADEDFTQRFLEREMPTVDDRRKYLDEHPMDGELQSGYRAEGAEQRRALMQSRLKELLEGAFYDRAKWRELNQFFEAVGAPAGLRDLNPKALLDDVLSGAQDETLDAEAETEALLKITETLPQWEIDYRARNLLPLPQNDLELMYGWVRDQRTEQIRNEVNEQRNKDLPDIAALGFEQAEALYWDVNRIVPSLNYLLPDGEAVPPLDFDYEDALDQDKTIKDQDRQELKETYKKYENELRNGTLAQEGEQAPVDPKLSAEDQRAQRKMLRDERHLRRVVRLDYMERKAAAEKRYRQRLEEAKDDVVMERYASVGASLSRVLGRLQGVNAAFSDNSLGQALRTFDEAWTQGDLKKGKELSERVDFAQEDVQKVQNDLENNDPLDIGTIKQAQKAASEEQNLQEEEAVEEEEEEQRSFTQIDMDFSVNSEEGDGLEAQEEAQPPQPKYYVFQKEYVDPELEQQKKLQQSMQEDLQAGERIINPPPVQSVAGQQGQGLKQNQEPVQPQVDQTQINPPQPVPAQPQNAAQAQGELHSASWWIKQLRSTRNLYTTNRETNRKELDVKKLAYIMAARDLAKSVRHEKENLLNTNLSLQQIKTRAVELMRKPDFSGFISKLHSDNALQREAISVVGHGHGGGLDDMFSRYLAQKAPGELPADEALKRWAPTALQRIEGLQGRLKQGNLDQLQSKKCVAEIIAARKLVEARRAGRFSHADERLKTKLTDTAKLNAKADDLGVCLNMLSGPQIQSLVGKAVDGHGGAMLEDFKVMNTVKTHMGQINAGLAFDEKHKVDAALAMAVYKENETNPDLQLDDSDALKTAAGLRKKPYYQEFAAKDSTQHMLKQEVNIRDMVVAFGQVENQLQQKQQGKDLGVDKDQIVISGNQPLAQNGAGFIHQG